MNFPSKITLALAAGSVLCPIAAYAGPTTGTTAAAVSIKFHDCKCGSTDGKFSIVPGGTANGGGAGVKELSAAVATGESQSDATSYSSYGGTGATAKGFSEPVNFKYVTYSDVSNRKDTRDYTAYKKSQVNQENQSQSKEKQSEYETYNANNNTKGNAASGTNGKATASNNTANSSTGQLSDGSGSSYASSNGKKSSSYTTSSNSGNGSKNTSEGSSSEGSRSQSGNSQNGYSDGVTDNTLNTLNKTKTGTTYEYTGSSAGLSYIPIIK
jgi:hypothetical protein